MVMATKHRVDIVLAKDRVEQSLHRSCVSVVAGGVERPGTGKRLASLLCFYLVAAYQCVTTKTQLRGASPSEEPSSPGFAFPPDCRNCLSSRASQLSWACAISVVPESVQSLSFGSDGMLGGLHTRMQAVVNRCLLTGTLLIKK